MLESTSERAVVSGPVADETSLRERLVVAPATGRFRPLPPDVFTSEGEWVERGQALARIDSGSGDVPVTSAFRGWVMGMLAVPGQPVARGDALFWIWHC